MNYMKPNNTVFCYVTRIIYSELSFNFIDIFLGNELVM